MSVTTPILMVYFCLAIFGIILMIFISDALEDPIIEGIFNGILVFSVIIFTLWFHKYATIRIKKMLRMDKND